MTKSISYAISVQKQAINNRLSNKK